MQDVVIISDFGMDDIDDAMAFILLKTFPNVTIKAVIASTFYATKRAKGIKLFLEELEMKNVPVYIGCGIEYSDEFNERFKK
ncbi:MAG: hypothetical protein Edafosvirus11_19 [Edafosvirus sp.]|uniref:Inosine/uridine-preferring nucleoside hydrolase domain-containing protein n=1 Tax=Edafosvirus sp. TaxID=2487765 RepID=A0A3G4ZVL4_9VIRU|nr:MAG: hypothetical protein Edafosvirus11_19 [Edafosvirus sp.]